MRALNRSGVWRAGSKRYKDERPGRGAIGDKLRERLLDLLVRDSYRRAADERFELSSGRRSNYYVDCKATTMRGEAMPLIGRLFAEMIPPNAEAVGGLTLGADAIAGATAFYCETTGRRLNSFTVRKTPKKHGLMKFVEGCPGSRVVVVDDVVTTGDSTIYAIRKCREAGFTVVGVIVLVDREEGGIEAVKAAAGRETPVTAVFKRSELEARWRALHGSDAGNSARPQAAAG